MQWTPGEECTTDLGSGTGKWSCSSSCIWAEYAGDCGTGTWDWQRQTAGQAARVGQENVWFAASAWCSSQVSKLCSTVQYCISTFTHAHVKADHMNSTHSEIQSRWCDRGIYICCNALKLHIKIDKDSKCDNASFQCRYMCTMTVSNNENTRQHIGIMGITARNSVC